MNPVADTLLKAAEYIDKGWAQGSFAISMYGGETSPLGETATRWCASGAIRRAAQVDLRDRCQGPMDVQHLVNACHEVVSQPRYIGDGTRDIPQWNDSGRRTQEEVAATLRRAARDVLAMAAEGQDTSPMAIMEWAHQRSYQADPVGPVTSVYIKVDLHSVEKAMQAFTDYCNSPEGRSWVESLRTPANKIIIPEGVKGIREIREVRELVPV